MDFQSIYDLVLHYQEEMEINDALHLELDVHEASMTFDFYKLPDIFTFDSETIISDVFNLCTAVNDDTQILIGKEINIDQDVILTPPFRCKGLIIACETLNNYGTISMTQRGATATGQDIYLYTDQFVPATGGAGATRVATSTRGQAIAGNSGGTSTTRGTGGGGGGSCVHGQNTGTATAGAGAAGSSYSGGSGGGGAGSTKGNATAGSGVANGGAGGNGAANSGENSSSYEPHSASGGAGNPGGSASIYRTGKGAGSASAGETGTGGLIVIYCDNFNNENNIFSNGSAGGSTSGTGYKSCGGGSGGGSINIFCNNEISHGTITADGGAGGTGGNANGGYGGNGCITFSQLTYQSCIVSYLFQNLSLTDYVLGNAYTYSNINSFYDLIGNEFPGFEFNHYEYQIDEATGTLLLSNYYDRLSYNLYLTNGTSQKYQYLFEEEGQLDYITGVFNDPLLKFKNWITDSGLIYRPYLKHTKFKMGSHDMTVYPEPTDQDRLNSNIYKNIFETLVFNLMSLQTDHVPYTRENLIAQINHGLDQYNLVYLDNDGLYKKALATEEKYGAVGFVTRIIDENQFILITYGLIDVNENMPIDLNYTSDSGILYLSDQTEGEFCTYEDITTGFYVPIGFYTGDTITISILDASVGSTLQKYQEVIFDTINIASLTENDINEVINEVLNNA